MTELPARRKSALSELGEVVWLSFPMIVTMTSQTLMQSVDALMLGHYGENELAAVMTAGLSYFIFGAFLIGVNSCNNTFVSQSLGRGQPEECGRYTIHAIYLSLLIQPVLVPLIAAARPLFALYGHEPNVQALEVTYFRVRALQLAGTGATVALATFFQGTGRAAVPMITGVVANVVNIIGDYSLIFGHFGLPRLGILGAGITTTCASYLEVTLLLLFFLSARNRAQYGTSRWLPIQPEKIWRLLRIGIAAGVTFALDLGSWTIFISRFLGRLGTASLAAYGAAQQIMHLSFMPTIGLEIGVTALVGRHIGEHDIAGAKRRAYLGMIVAACYMSLVAVLTVIFRRQLISVFNDQPDVVRAGEIILVYVALFQFSDAFGILSQGALRGAGDTVFPAVLIAVLAFFFFLPLSYYLGRPDVLGVHGCWIAATVYIWAVDALLFWRFVSEGWRKIDIFR